MTSQLPSFVVTQLPSFSSFPASSLFSSLPALPQLPHLRFCHSPKPWRIIRKHHRQVRIPQPVLHDLGENVPVVQRDSQILARLEVLAREAWPSVREHLAAGDLLAHRVGHVAASVVGAAIAVLSRLRPNSEMTTTVTPYDVVP